METVSFKICKYEEDGAIALLTLNRPDALNALNEESRYDIAQFASYLNSADHLKIGIITGSGDKAFCAGADVENLKNFTSVDSIQRNYLRPALNTIENGKKPVIAAINGYAFGGGFELALACDIRIVSENAFLGLPEPDLGLLPGAGGTQRLTKIAGPGIAKDIILAGRKLNAQEAVTHGLAMKVVPISDLMTEARKVANRILSKGPVALQLSKQLINAATHNDVQTGLLMESYAQGLLFGSQDPFEGLNAFLEKRKPDFQGK